MSPTRLLDFPWPCVLSESFRKEHFPKPQAKEELVQTWKNAKQEGKVFADAFGFQELEVSQPGPSDLWICTFWGASSLKKVI